MPLDRTSSKTDDRWQISPPPGGSSMRYRYVSYRYAVRAPARRPQPLGVLLPFGIGLGEPRWRPEADVYETSGAITVVVELGGIEEEDVEVTLFEDALVVEGQRRLACEEEALYHMAAIRQGPFRLEAPLPAAVDHDGVEARYERGLLRIHLPKAKR
jgi:HSP20 family protein